jgi:hypothetical protein
MSRENELRSTYVSHVIATNNLDGARVSAFFASKMAEYRAGKISSSELLAATQAQYRSK